MAHNDSAEESTPYVYHRIASDHVDHDGGTTNWYEMAHAACAQALPSGSQIYTPTYPPGVFDVDVYNCELCGAIIGAVLAIGGDDDQWNEAPGKVLTSMTKQADVAVFEAILRSAASGHAEPVAPT